MTDIGDLVILQAEFRDRGGELANPDSVSGWVLAPGATEPDGVGFAAVSVGIWEAEYSPHIEGKHWWRVEGIGAVTAAGERHFTVNHKEVVH